MSKKGYNKGFYSDSTSILSLIFWLNFSKFYQKISIGGDPIEILKGSKTPFLDHFLSLGKCPQQDQFELLL